MHQSNSFRRGVPSRVSGILLLAGTVAAAGLIGYGLGHVRGESKGYANGAATERQLSEARMHTAVNHIHGLSNDAFRSSVFQGARISPEVYPFNLNLRFSTLTPEQRKAYLSDNERDPQVCFPVGRTYGLAEAADSLARALDSLQNTP